MLLVLHLQQHPLFGLAALSFHPWGSSLAFLLSSCSSDVGWRTLSLAHYQQPLLMAPQRSPLLSIGLMLLVLHLQQHPLFGLAALSLHPSVSSLAFLLSSCSSDVGWRTLSPAHYQQPLLLALQRSPRLSIGLMLLVLHLQQHPLFG